MLIPLPVLRRLFQRFAVLGKAGSKRPDAENTCEQLPDRCAEHRVTMRAAAVPVFPDGGCAAALHVQV